MFYYCPTAFSAMIRAPFYTFHPPSLPFHLSPMAIKRSLQ